MTEELTSYHGLRLEPTMPIHVEKMIRPFDGTGDLTAWIRKFKMAVKLQKLGDLHEVLPLFLEGAGLCLLRGNGRRNTSRQRQD